MTSTNDSKASRYDDLVWNHAMKLALDVNKKDEVLKEFMKLVLDKLGFPTQPGILPFVIEKPGRGSTPEGDATSLSGNVIIRLPQGNLAIFVAIKIPSDRVSRDYPITITFNNSPVVVTGVDSYASICNVAYDAIKKQISLAS